MEKGSGADELTKVSESSDAARQSRRRLTAEVAALARLQSLTTRLLNQSDLRPALAEVLDAAIDLLDADSGNLRVYEPSTRTLTISVHRGLNDDFLQNFASVVTDDSDAGGLLRSGIKVLMKDVDAGVVDRTLREAARIGNFRAWVALPLLGAGGVQLGVLTTHFREPHAPRKDSLRRLDLYAQQAAILIERGRDLDRLHHSDERFRAIFNQSAAGMAQSDAQGRIVLANQRFCEMLGYPESELLLSDHIRIASPDGASLSGQMTVGSAGANFEARYRRRDGSMFWASVSVNALKGPAGEHQGFVGMFIDIDERKRAEGRTSFLIGLDDATRRFDDPEQINRISARLLGEYLDADRCAYATVEEDQDHFTITGDYTRNVASSAGRFNMTAFGAVQAMQAGEPWIVTDYGADPRLNAEQRETYQRIQLAAVICVPLIKAGRFAAAVAVHQTSPRLWTADEVWLVETVAQRMWESIERARIASALREREQRLRHFADTLPNIAWETTADGQVVWFNLGFFRYTGVAVSSALGWNWESVFDADDAPAYVEAWQRSVATQATFEARARLRRHDGVMRWWIMRAEPQRDTGGQVLRWFGSATDIDDFVRAEHALAESERQFRTLADTMPQLTWMARADGYTYWYNQRWFDYTGTTLEQMQGWGWRSVHDPSLLKGIERRFSDALKAGDDWEDTYPLRDHRGQYRWFLSRAQPLRDEAGRITRWFGTHTDVTEQRRVGAALHEADRRKDEFLATLAHELRNPLAPIRNAVTLLRMAGAGNAGIEPLREVLERQVNHLVRLVDDLVDISRISRGTVELRREPADLGVAIATAVESVQPLIDARAHRIELSVEPMTLDADPVRLSQIITNLLGNAAKYSDEGGHIHLAASLDNGSALIIVRDTGIGIAAPMLSQVFDMFAQVDRRRKGPGGLGIGLALVKRLVELHGGTIEARSEGIGKGSEFIVRLPNALPARDTATPTGNAPAMPAPVPARVLVIDDNVDAADSLAMVLKHLGMEVSVSYDGPAALEIFAREPPACVFLDIGMPGMDGYEVARRLRGISAEVVLIALTGWGQEEDRRRTRDAGFDHHLVKPVDVEVLEQLLASLGSSSGQGPAHAV